MMNPIEEREQVRNALIGQTIINIRWATDDELREWDIEVFASVIELSGGDLIVAADSDFIWGSYLYLVESDPAGGSTKLLK